MLHVQSFASVSRLWRAMELGANLCLLLLICCCLSSSQPLSRTDQEEHIDSEFGVRSLDPNVQVYRVADVPRQRQHVSRDEDDEYEESVPLPLPAFQMGRRPPSSNGWSYDTRQAVPSLPTEETSRPMIRKPRPHITILNPVPMIVHRPMVVRQRRPAFDRSLMADAVTAEPSTSTETPITTNGASIATATRPIVLAPKSTPNPTEATSRPMTPELIFLCIVCGLVIAVICAVLVYGIVVFCQRMARRKHQRRPITSKIASVIKIREPIIPDLGPMASDVGAGPEIPIVPDLGPLVGPPPVPLVVLSEQEKQSRQAQVLTFQQPRDEEPVAHPLIARPEIPIIPSLGPLLGPPPVPLTVLPDPARALPSAPADKQGEEHVVVQVTAPLHLPFTSPPASSSAGTSTDNESTSGASEPAVLGVIDQRNPDHESVGIDELPEAEIRKILHPNKKGK